jgi:uncharacterized protein (TIGR03000 family)
MKYTLLLLAAFACVALATAQESSKAAPATITVKLPAEAKLYFGDTLVTARGSTRTFQTPSALEPGRAYNWWVVRAVLERDGETISVSRKVTLKAGEETIVDFGNLRPGGASEKAVEADPDDDSIPGLPRGTPPRLQLVKMDGSALTIGEMIPKTVAKTGYRTVVDKEGKKQTVAYTYNECVWVCVCKTVASGQLFDSAGRTIAPERWAEVLPGETAVLLSDAPGYAAPTIDPIYLAAFTPEILRLKVEYQPQGPQVLPALPGPPPEAPKKVQPRPADEGVKAPSVPKADLLQPKAMSVKTRPPLVCLARLDSKGQLRLRECSQQPMEYVIKKTVEEAGVLKEVEVKLQKHFLSVTTERFDPADYKAFGADGKPLAAEDLARALARERAVLISADKELPDAVYLKAVKPGVPVLLLSRPFGHGSYGGYNGGYGVPMPGPAPGFIP